ncbi:MAG TPA: alanine--glyoxylate aminotransferase family protein [Solirubrobacteraceae bacterium]|jgi:alanine-glyoxylate transaminase/serine-glyoxylate transaminase/serine-pyruvate transaminase|nr:alanine--glyoxylate aminotransferase family protein [Solirubrobacteraceae bacterium]
MTHIPSPIHPPQRLLCGPGPCNVSPAALEAMQRPMLGHMDPDFADILLQVVALLRIAYQASGGLVLPLQSTGTAGMEAGLAHLLEPGEVAIVGVNGFFGRRIVEIARRLGAEVVAVEADWGEQVPNDRLLDAVEAHPGARLVCVVHAETSTGVQHPLAELGSALRDTGVLLMADCVTSLGGIELDFDGWGIDYAYSCTQKCVGAPPGMSPVAVSDRAMERIEARTHPVSYSLDLQLLRDYWIKRPLVYHHTAPILHIYALHEALREVAVEGLHGRWDRHMDAGRFLQSELRSRGLDLLADPEHQLPQLTAVRVPEGVDGKGVQMSMLRDHGIEIGGGLGPSAPDMWRIGLMGHNARRDIAERVLTALDEVLAAEPALAQSA